jgi:hypothetical protein
MCHFWALAVSTLYRPDNQRAIICWANLAIFLILAMPYSSGIYLGKMSIQGANVRIAHYG